MIIKIAEEFTDTPGARYESQGPFSGERFRDELLYPKFKEALKKNEELCVDMDGGYGYGSSFVEEAFGGLVRKLKKDRKNKDYLKVRNIKIISNENRAWITKIAVYIENAIKNPVK